MRTARRRLLPLAILGLTLAGMALAQSGTPSAAPANGTVTVQPGDSLWSIARRYGTTVKALVAANQLAGDRLQSGATLRLPNGSDDTPTSYVVQPGDTLYGIALAFRLSVEDLIAYNDLGGSVIHPGQRLTLRPGKTAPPLLEVTVQPGDSLWGIAQRHGVSVEALAAANGIAAGAVLHPGDTLAVPGQYAATASSDVGGPVPSAVTVTKGESLWSIAHAYGTTISALMSANGLSSAELVPGQTLIVIPPEQLGRAVPPAAQPRPEPLAAMRWPLRGRITSYYGFRILQGYGADFHTGIDIAGNTGDPILAAIGGTVELAGWNGDYGLCVIVRNGDAEYYYGHASVLLVKRGESVKQGQPIARVGSTGFATGPHLHFEIRVHGQPVDPLPYLDPRAGR